MKRTPFVFQKFCFMYIDITVVITLLMYKQQWFQSFFWWLFYIFNDDLIITIQRVYQIDNHIFKKSENDFSIVDYYIPLIKRHSFLIEKNNVKSTSKSEVAHYQCQFNLVCVFSESICTKNFFIWMSLYAHSCMRNVDLFWRLQ